MLSKQQQNSTKYYGKVNAIKIAADMVTVEVLDVGNESLNFVLGEGGGGVAFFPLKLQDKVRVRPANSSYHCSQQPNEGCISLPVNCAAIPAASTNVILKIEEISGPPSAAPGWSPGTQNMIFP